MAKKKRRVRYDHLILLILLFILLILGTFFALKALFSDEEDKPNNNNQNIIIDNSTMTIELINYEVYKDINDDLGFNFIVAELNFKDDKAIDYDLNNLITDEKIIVKDIFEYQKKMNINNYDYDALKTTLDITSNQNELKARVFIPYIDERNLVILTDSISGKSFSINANNNLKNIDDIKYKSSSSEIRTSSYKFKISNNYISTTMLHNNESYDSSMLAVYTFDLTVEEIKDDIRIVSATFIQDDTNESWEALDASYSSIKRENIINKELNINDTYALFFEVYSNNNEKPRYEGKIDLKFNDGSTIRIDTIFN